RAGRKPAKPKAPSTRAPILIRIQKFQDPVTKKVSNIVEPESLATENGVTIRFLNSIRVPAIILFKPGPIDIEGVGIRNFGNDWYGVYLDPAYEDGPSESVDITVTQRSPGLGK